jgi:hypothetical protein
MIKQLIIATSLSLALSPVAWAGETPSAPNTKQYFVNLSDGDTVSSPVKVIFGLSGMGIAPSGVENENTGHHHILLDRAPIGEGEDGEEEFEYGILADENNIHYGKGQTETVLDLAPGEHTLQLVLGDALHVPHNPPIFSERITITVK